MIKRIEVICKCGKLGRLTGTNEMKDKKQVCKFVCGCENPEVNFDKPW